jgi:hypothetical protein
LFNFNKQLMIETSNDATSTKNLASGLSSTKNLNSDRNAFSPSSERHPISTRSGVRSRRHMTAQSSARGSDIGKMSHLQITNLINSYKKKPKLGKPMF